MNPKTEMHETWLNGALGIIILITYCGLTFYAMVRWNDSVSQVLVTGFVLFAQSALRNLFDFLKDRKAKSADSEQPVAPVKP